MAYTLASTARHLAALQSRGLKNAFMLESRLLILLLDMGLKRRLFLFYWALIHVLLLGALQYTPANPGLGRAISDYFFPLTFFRNMLDATLAFCFWTRKLCALFSRAFLSFSTLPSFQTPRRTRLLAYT
jgi:hypothetical protein